MTIAGRAARARRRSSGARRPASASVVAAGCAGGSRGTFMTRTAKKHSRHLARLKSGRAVPTVLVSSGFRCGRRDGGCVSLTILPIAGRKEDCMKLTLIAVAALALSAGAHADMTFDLGTVAGTVPVGNTLFCRFVHRYVQLQPGVGVHCDRRRAEYIVFDPAVWALAGQDQLLRSVARFHAPCSGCEPRYKFGGVRLVVQSSSTRYSPIPILAGPHTLTFAGSGDASSGAYTGSLTVTAGPSP